MSNLSVNATERAAQHGWLFLEGETLTYRTPSGSSISTPIPEIAAIGEYTTSEGPYLDDWFLVLVRRGSGEYLKLPMYVEGIETLCEQLSEHLGSSVQVGLANRADFASRIMWPPELVDRPLFVVSQARDGNFLRRIVSFCIREKILHLSPDVLFAAGPDV